MQPNQSIDRHPNPGIRYDPVNGNRCILGSKFPCLNPTGHFPTPHHFGQLPVYNLILFHGDGNGRMGSKQILASSQDFNLRGADWKMRQTPPFACRCNRNYVQHGSISNRVLITCQIARSQQSASVEAHNPNLSVPLARVNEFGSHCELS